jgi:hypothetical protein
VPNEGKVCAEFEDAAERSLVAAGGVQIGRVAGARYTTRLLMEGLDFRPYSARSAPPATPAYPGCIASSSARGEMTYRVRVRRQRREKRLTYGLAAAIVTAAIAA